MYKRQTQILANAGALQKFDVDALKADTEYKFDDFWDAAENYCTYDGDWYSLPLDGGNYGWVYNVDMFDKCGIEVPEDGFTSVSYTHLLPGFDRYPNESVGWGEDVIIRLH